MDKEDLLILKKKIAELSEAEKRLRDIYLRQIATGEILGPSTGYASIDKPWIKYYDEEILTKEIPNQTIFQYFKESTSSFLDKTALDLRMSYNNFDKSIRKMTYRQVIEEIVTIACAFRKIGISENEILLQMLPNFIESRETIYASNANGTTIYPISPMIPTSKTEEIIDSNNISTVIVFSGFYEKFKDVLKNPKIKRIIYLNGTESFDPIMKKIIKFTDKEKKYSIPKDPRIITWDEIIKIGKKYRKQNKITTASNFQENKDYNRIAVIVGTSGTTGIPKGSCLSNKALNACDFSEKQPKPFEVGEVNLDILIQSISYGLGIMHHTMCGGLYNILIPELITDKISELIAKFNPHHFSGGPIHYENIRRSKEFKDKKIKQPKNYLSGGATLAKDTEKELNGDIDENYVEPKTGPTKVFVRQGLGLTENTGTGIFSTRGAYKFGSVGIPIAYSNASIFEPDTENELIIGEVGEICLSGPTMMEYYLNNPEETEKLIKIHSDGTKWLHTGDKGYMDEDGHVFMIDRYKNIFMRAGFNVHPSKIANTLKELEEIEDCYVVGIDHPTEMTVPVAFIVLKEDVSEDSIVNKLNDVCYSKLEEYYIPYEYVFIQELPRNISGKVDEKALLEQNKIDYSKDQKKKLNLR